MGVMCARRMTEFWALSVLLLAMAGWSSAGGYGKMIVVGGKEHWRFGYNYSAWAEASGPFHAGDTLVFIYKPSTFNGITVNHNVYKLHSRKAYEQCSFAQSIILANTTQGDPGFHFTLTERNRPVYFACGIGEGLHCNEGLMKFYVVPR
ncbi:hypothetical protein KP509_25G025700 [Ceratopteris richardii]|uniref:Phytocyanin domain-containing protein n=1 Tax=Ceratopteris richardii TaxID=49495 RepID=A0A8T2RNJ8_CERRI|nr:hypothetical protein KP509_25G025700 [Ceratopteris richardii]